MSSFVFNKTTYPTSDVTNFAESAIHILHIFANNFAIKRDSVISKRPIDLFFHAVSHKAIEIFVANVLE